MQNLFELVIRLPGKLENLSYDDITEFVSTNSSSNPIKALEEFLRKEPKECIFYFQLGNGHKLTEGYQLGTGTLHSFESLPKDVKEHLIPRLSIKNIKTENGQIVNPEEVQKRESWYMKLKVTSIGSVKAIENACVLWTPINDTG